MSKTFWKRVAEAGVPDWPDGRTGRGLTWSVRPVLGPVGGMVGGAGYVVCGAVCLCWIGFF